MNQLRRQDICRYSRKGIALNREALREWLKPRFDGSSLSSSLWKRSSLPNIASRNT